MNEGKADDGVNKFQDDGRAVFETPPNSLTVQTGEQILLLVVPVAPPPSISASVLRHRLLSVTVVWRLPCRDVETTVVVVEVLVLAEVMLAPVGVL